MPRWLKALRAVAIALVLLFFAAVLALFGYLNSGAGSARVRQAIIGNLNQSIQGHVALGKVSVLGSTLVLRNLKVTDPAGRTVASVERVSAHVSLPALAHHELRLTSVRIERPHLDLVLTAEGMNLSQALRSKTQEPAAKRALRPSPEKPKSRPFSLSIGDLEIEGGELSFLQRLPKATRHFEATGISGKGQARYLPEQRDATAKLHLGGKLVTPVAGPLGFDVATHTQGASQVVRLDAQAAGARLRANASVLGPVQRVEIAQLELLPKTGRAVLPSWPLQVPLEAHGGATVRGKQARFTLAVNAGTGRAKATGTLALDGAHPLSLQLDAAGVDLAQLSAKGPKSRLALRLEAHATAPRWTDVNGTVQANVPVGELRGEPFGPLALRLHADQGEFVLESLEGKLPGAEVSIHGRASKQEIALSGSVRADDLEKLQEAIAPAPTASARVHGRGVVRFSLRGPTRAPAAILDAELPYAARGNLAARGLRLEAHAPRGREGGLSAELSARRLVFNQRPLERVRAKVQRSGDALRAELHAGPLALSARGALLGPRRVRLSALELRLPQETWRLEQPAELTLGTARTRISRLSLRSGPQRIALDGSFGRTLEADVTVDQLELGKLPLDAFTRAPKLGGVLDLAGHARGTMRAPEARLSARLRHGRVGSLAPIELAARGHYQDGRAVGQLSLRSRPAMLNGHFDLPLAAIRRGGHAPVTARIDLERLSLGELAKVEAPHPVHPERSEAESKGQNAPDALIATRASGRRTGHQANSDPSTPDLRSYAQGERDGISSSPKLRPISGELHGTLLLSGTARDPRLRLALKGSGLRVADHAPPLDLGLAVRTERSGGLLAEFDLRTLGTGGSLHFATEDPLGELLRRPRSLLAARMRAQVQVRALPLAPFGLSTRTGQPVSGTLSLFAELRGTARAPVGRARASVSQLSVGPMQPLGVDVSAQLGQRTVASLTATRPGKRLLTGRFELDAPLGVLADRARLERTPFLLTATVGPVHPGDLQWTKGERLERQGQLQATVSGRLEAHGTLRSPKLSLRTSVDQLQVKGAPEAHGTFELAYADRALTGGLRLVTQHHGTLAATLRSAIDLSYPALTGAHVSLKDAPTHAALAIDDFRPDFLVGILPSVTDLGGRIDGHARFDGTLDAPRLEGKLTWNEGAFGLEGYGTYRPIQLVAEADGHELRLSPFTVRRGDGRAQLLAVIDFGPTLRVHGRLDAEQLPLTTGYLPRGALTLAALFEAQLQDGRLTLDARTLRQTQFDLPKGQPKEVIALQPVYGVEMVDSEKALNAPFVGPQTPPVQPSRRAYARTRPPRRPSSPPRQARAAQTPGSTVRPPPSTLRARITLEAPQGVAVRGDTADLEVKVSKDFRVLYRGAPLFFGELTVQRGQLVLLGRHVNALEGTRIRLSGPLAAGYVEISAAHANPEGERTVVVGRRTGPPPGNVAVRPYRPQSFNEMEIYRYLSTGQLGLSPFGPRGKSPAFVGGFEGSLAQQLIAAKVPLTLLGIEAGGEEYAVGAYRAGTWLSDKLFLGYSSRLEADPEEGENETALSLQYQLGPVWSVDLEYGDAEAGSADLVWRKRF